MLFIRLCDGLSISGNFALYFEVFLASLTKISLLGYEAVLIDVLPIITASCPRRL
jgi:hypothetical protein